MWGLVAGFADTNIIAVVAPQPASSTLPHSLTKSTCRLPLPLRLFFSFILFQPFLQILLVLPQLLHGLLVLLLQGCSILLLDLGGGLIGGFLIAFFMALSVKPNKVAKTEDLVLGMFVFPELGYGDFLVTRGSLQNSSDHLLDGGREVGKNGFTVGEGSSSFLQIISGFQG